MHLPNFKITAPGGNKYLGARYYADFVVGSRSYVSRKQFFKFIRDRSVGEVFELLGCWCFLAFLKTERNRLKREILDGNFYIVHCN